MLLHHLCIIVLTNNNHIHRYWMVFVWLYHEQSYKWSSGEVLLVHQEPLASMVTLWMLFVLFLGSAV